MADHMPQKALRFSLAALEVEAVQSTSSDWQRVLAATHTLFGQGGGAVAAWCKKILYV